jgi:hypothetical protein
MDRSQGDGESNPGRRSPFFDPVAGMRAMADIQAEGFRAAGELIDRMLGSEPDGPGRARSSAAGGDYSALVDAWTDLLRRTVAGLARPDGTDAVTVSVDSTGVGPQVRLATSGDSAATTEVWLHNGSFSAIGPLALGCGQLSDPDGTVLEGAEVSFEPAEVTLLPARSSRAVTVSLAAAGSLRPGCYRGMIQARGAPGLWLPFEVAVE